MSEKKQRGKIFSVDNKKARRGKPCLVGGWPRPLYPKRKNAKKGQFVSLKKGAGSTHEEGGGRGPRTDVTAPMIHRFQSGITSNGKVPTENHQKKKT